MIMVMIHPSTIRTGSILSLTAVDFIAKIGTIVFFVTALWIQNAVTIVTSDVLSRVDMRVKRINQWFRMLQKANKILTGKHPPGKTGISIHRFRPNSRDVRRIALRCQYTDRCCTETHVQHTELEHNAIGQIETFKERVGNFKEERTI